MRHQKKIISIIAVILAILMAFSLVASVLPTVFAISQSDIDALQAKKDELSARVAEAEERVNTLKDAEANVLDKKAALEDQNDAAKQIFIVPIPSDRINDKLGLSKSFFAIGKQTWYCISKRKIILTL